MRPKNHLIGKATLLFLFITLGFASCEAAIPIDTTAPASVTNLQAKSLEGKILLTWTDPADSDLFGIKIYIAQESKERSVSSNDGILVGKGIQKYEITNLEDGKYYTFKVSAVDLAGNESPIVTSESVKFTLKVIREVDINYVLNGGSMDVTKETLPANSPLTQVPVKDGVFFNGWVDADNNLITNVPEEDCTLYATWGDKMDIIYVLNSENEIELNALRPLYEKFPNAALGYKVTPLLDTTEKIWWLKTNSPLMHPITIYTYSGENEEDYYFDSPRNTDSLYLRDLFKICDNYGADKIILNSTGDFFINEVFISNDSTLILLELELNGGSETGDETKPPVMRKDSSTFGYTLTLDEDGSYAAVYFYEYNPEGELIDVSYWYVTKTGYTLEGVYRDENFTISCGDENSLFTVGNEAKFYLKWIEN